MPGSGRRLPAAASRRQVQERALTYGGEWVTFGGGKADRGRAAIPLYGRGEGLTIAMGTSRQNLFQPLLAAEVGSSI